VRPGHDYEWVVGTGSASSGGRIYLYDSVWDRVIGFGKEDGSYVGQWVPAPGDPQMEDVRGMYVIPGKKTKKRRDPDTLVWITPEGLYESVLVTERAPADGGDQEA